LGSDAKLSRLDAERPEVTGEVTLGERASVAPLGPWAFDHIPERLEDRLGWETVDARTGE
jgi:hypothetical protein